VLALRSGISVGGALDEISSASFSRIPIYDDTIDNITGVIHIRDVLKAVGKGKRDVTLKSISFDPMFVSEESIISEVFKRFQKKRMHMAVVVDEFGGTSGIVTLEDLMEEIVGEIMDESDVVPKNILRLDKKTVLVKGDVEIEELNDVLNSKIPVKEHYHLLNAYLLHELKGLPKKGEKTEKHGLLFTIQEVSDKEILAVRIASLDKS